MRMRPRQLGCYLTLCLVSALGVLFGCEGPGPAYRGFVGEADTYMNRSAGKIAQNSVKNDPTLTDEQKATFANETAQFIRAIEAAQNELASRN